MATQEKQLVVPVFEGQRLDRYRLAFTGSIELDPTDPDDLETIHKLLLGREVDLSVSGAVVSRPHKVTRDKEGWVKTIHGGASISVHSFKPADVEVTREPDRGGPDTAADAF
jgi:hypothetical protein